MWPGFLQRNKSHRTAKTNSSPPSCHARATHHCEARVDTVARVARADADEIIEPAESPIPTHQRAQPVAAHDLVAIEMRPMLPLPKITITTKTPVQIIGNANEPKLHRFEPQAFPLCEVAFSSVRAPFVS
jgi:hypothetical protein